MILILGGTSTTHNIISELTTDHIVTVATEYGLREFSARYGNKVLLKRFSLEELVDFISTNDISEVIDTTHPHAKEITKNAKEACEKTGVKYTDRVRKTDDISYEQMHTFTGYEDAVKHLKEKGYKSIIITTGSNNIAEFNELADVSYARVLPFEKSIKACLDAGFHYSRIIAMQGPFSEEFNIALIKELKADCMVTKNSGEGSGYAEKVAACKMSGIDIVTLQPE